MIDGRYPWRSHRTLAEVAETERLRGYLAIGKRLMQIEWRYLEVLTAKERAANPPPPDPAGDAA